MMSAQTFGWSHWGKKARLADQGSALWTDPKEPCPSQYYMAQLINRLRSRLLAPPTSTERFQAIFLDYNRSCLGEVILGSGSSNTLLLRQRELFTQALSLQASAMILAHNHPSGDCRPSANDIKATMQIAQISRALEIEMVDHLILTERSVYSMRAGEELQP